MANETFLTIVGSIYQDPELKQVGNSQVANLVIVVNARKFNRDTNEWENKPGKFWRCQAWDQGKLQLAQNVHDQLKDRDNVVAYGELVTREYEQDGKKRTADEVRIETIGKDLRWHSTPATGNAPAASDGSWTPPAAGGGWGSTPSGNGGWPSSGQADDVPF